MESLDTNYIPSWNEMRNKKEYTNKFKVTAIEVCEPVYSTVFDDKTKRFVKRCCMQKVDRAKQMENYRVSDFKLENLIAVDSPLLKQQSKLSNSRFSDIEFLETSASNIDKQLFKTE